MESLDLTYKLIESTLCLKYFRNIVIVMTKGKNKKMKNTKILFIFAATPSYSGRGGGLLHPPHFPTFSTAKFFENFSIDTWVSVQRVGKLTVWQS